MSICSINSWRWNGRGRGDLLIQNQDHSWEDTLCGSYAWQIDSLKLEGVTYIGGMEFFKLKLSGKMSVMW